MDDAQALAAFSQAVVHIARLEHAEAELAVDKHADDGSVSALTLLAELAWCRSLMSEDQDELKEAMVRLERAEQRALKVCDAGRGTMLGSLYKLASGQSMRHKTETKAAQIQEVVDCTNLAYLYLMEALAHFRGTSKNYLSGALKLKASWRLYKYLGENEANLVVPQGGKGSGSSKIELFKKKDKAGRGRWKILSEFALSISQPHHASGETHVQPPPRSTEGGTGLHDSDDDGGEDVKVVEEKEHDEDVEKKKEAAKHEDSDDDFFDASSSNLSPTVEDEVMEGELEEYLPSHTIGDIYYGLGGFHFFVSMVPSGYKWIVESLGFRGDREAGRKELQECVKRRGHRSASATLLLLWMDTFFYKDRQNAEKMLLQAQDLFEAGGKKPSPLFRYLGGYLARVQGHMDVAISRFLAAKAASVQVPVLQMMCDYEIGWCHFLQNQFDKCIDYFIPFMRDFKAPSYRAYCAYQLGCALDIAGRAPEARPYMAVVHKYVRKNYTFDTFAARKAAQWLKTGSMSEYDKIMLEVFNTLEIKRFQEAFEPLSRAKKLLSTKLTKNVRQLLPLKDGQSTVEVERLSPEDVSNVNDSSALYLYSLGRAFRGVGKIEEARECYQKILAAESVVKEETYILPYTHCEVGELLLKEGKFVDARHHLKIAKTRYLNYDFDKPLGRRLKLAMDLVKEKKRETADFLTPS